MTATVCTRPEAGPKSNAVCATRTGPRAEADFCYNLTRVLLPHRHRLWRYPDSPDIELQLLQPVILLVHGVYLNHLTVFVSEILARTYRVFIAQTLCFIRRTPIALGHKFRCRIQFCI